jgi:hypothetical protein
MEEAYQTLQKTASDAGVLEGIGRQAVLSEMMEMPTEVNTPTRYNLAWRAWMKDFARCHMVRHYPQWVARVNDDYVFNCDLIKSLDVISWSCVGWDFDSEQVKFYCVDISHRYSPPPIATEKFISLYIYSLRNDPSGSKHLRES